MSHARMLRNKQGDINSNVTSHYKGVAAFSVMYFLNDPWRDIQYNSFCFFRLTPMIFVNMRIFPEDMVLRDYIIPAQVSEAVLRKIGFSYFFA